MEEGETFFAEFWPQARAVADPQRRFYDAFQLYAGSLRQLFGPGVWLKAVKTYRKGYRSGKPVGNPWIMPGIFLVCRRRIVWSHRFKHVAHHPDFQAMPRRLREHASECL